jgi:hypothetical protein
MRAQKTPVYAESFSVKGNNSTRRAEKRSAFRRFGDDVSAGPVMVKMAGGAALFRPTAALSLWVIYNFV